MARKTGRRGGNTSKEKILGDAAKLVAALSGASYSAAELERFVGLPAYQVRRMLRAMGQAGWTVTAVPRKARREGEPGRTPVVYSLSGPGLVG